MILTLLVEAILRKDIAAAIIDTHIHTLHKRVSVE